MERGTLNVPAMWCAEQPLLNQALRNGPIEPNQVVNASLDTVLLIGREWRDIKRRDDVPRLRILTKSSMRKLQPSLPLGSAL